jgi:GTPase involved in cell partitioning and DNA repair
MKTPSKMSKMALFSQFSDARGLAVADLPGIDKGAAENRGLGHAFLR